MLKLNQDTTKSLANVMRSNGKSTHADYLERMGGEIQTLLRRIAALEAELATAREEVASNAPKVRALKYLLEIARSITQLHLKVTSGSVLYERTELLIRAFKNYDAMTTSTPKAERARVVDSRVKDDSQFMDDGDPLAWMGEEN